MRTRAGLPSKSGFVDSGSQQIPAFDANVATTTDKCREKPEEFFLQVMLTKANENHSRYIDSCRFIDLLNRSMQCFDYVHKTYLFKLLINDVTMTKSGHKK